jgi:hypothetical protein
VDAGFRKRSCSIKKLKRDDDSKKRHSALVMAEIFKDMIRTVCRQTLRLGTIRGAVAVTARFRERPDDAALEATLENLMEDKAVACGEVWSAVTTGELPLSEEERLRGGDRRIACCLLVETLRLPDAERIAGALATRFSARGWGLSPALRDQIVACPGLSRAHHSASRGASEARRP